MKHRSRLSNLPVRLAAGAFILNSGLSKLQADKETATQVHGFAAGAYPMFDQIPPERFIKMLGGAEVALGGALLVPFAVSDGLAGLSLSAFAGGLLGLYAKTPGMREEGGVRPTKQGIPLAKDVWLAGIGASLVVHSLAARLQHRRIARAKHHTAPA